MHHGGVQRRFLDRFTGLVPGRVVIPAGDIDLLCHLEIVDAVKPIHHIGGKFGIGGNFFDGIPLKFQKIDMPVADEALPVKRKRLHGVFALWGRAFDLFPIGVVMAPEAGVPCLVQCLQRPVPCLQPAAELRLTQCAVAVPAHLVGDVPKDDCRIIPKSLRQLLVDDAHFLMINWRGIAVILTPVVQFPHAVSPHTAHLRVLVCQPCGACSTGGRQNRADPVGVKVMDDVRQPVQLEHTLLRLQHRP